MTHEKRPTPFLKIPRGTIYYSGTALQKACLALLKGTLVRGAHISAFEQAFAHYIGVPHAFATYSGTVSLCVCLEVLGIKANDEIICPAYIVPEVVEVFRTYQIKPVFVDITTGSYNMDAEAVAAKISPKTKAILMVHMYGEPCAIDRIRDIARKHDVFIIEDCAQACGAEYKGKKVGTFGTLAYFSFGMLKNLNTLGGGMIVTSNESRARAVRETITQYKAPRCSDILKKFMTFIMLIIATNRVVFSLFVYPFIRLMNACNTNVIYTLFRGNKKSDTDMQGITALQHRYQYSNLQALIGFEHLKNLDRNNSIRINYAATLSALMKTTGVYYPRTSIASKNIFVNYVILVMNRETLQRRLLKAGIDTTCGYIECFSQAPLSERVRHENVYLPIHPSLKPTDIKYIGETVSAILNDT